MLKMKLIFAYQIFDLKLLFAANIVALLSEMGCCVKLSIGLCGFRLALLDAGRGVPAILDREFFRTWLSNLSSVAMQIDPATQRHWPNHSRFANVLCW